jgi:hypothetical protein
VHLVGSYYKNAAISFDVICTGTVMLCTGTVMLCTGTVMLFTGTVMLCTTELRALGKVET